MNAVLLFVFGIFAVQSSYAQCIRSGPIIQTDTVANTLADTLSLLTVSSLLAEKLPFEYPCGCAPFVPPCNTPYPCPTPCCPSIAPYEIISPYNCGCGCNGFGPYNTPYEIIPPVMNNCGCCCNGFGPYNGPYEIISPPIINNCGCGCNGLGPYNTPYEIISPIMNNCGCGCNGLGPYNAYLL